MHGHGGPGIEGTVGAAIALALAEERALQVALAVAAAVVEPCETRPSSFSVPDTGRWGRAAMAYQAAGPLGLLRRT